MNHESPNHLNRSTARLLPEADDPEDQNAQTVASIDRSGVSMDRAGQLSVTQASEPPQPVRNAQVSRMRFTYPSGSKPLDGYTIKRGIGIGGFGEVYFAVSDAGKEVALKRIQRNVDVELRGVSQCLNLKHVNLITLWDIKQDEHGEGWVVMEYVPGPNLRDLLNDSPDGLPQHDSLTWFAAVCRGVAYLHDHGIVHRDLKPGNIFRDDDQVVKIGDYGLAKFISCSRRSGQTESVGTFHYMAPEIGKGVYGKEIDIYALGIILYELLTGRVPFDGESSQEIIMKHLTADPAVDDVAEPYRRIIRKALHKDPDRRFSNVKEMLEQLEANPIPEPSDRSAGQATADSVAAPQETQRRTPTRVRDESQKPPRRHSQIASTSYTAASKLEPMFIGDSEDDVMYIGDDIQMGDLHEVMPAEVVGPQAKKTSAGVPLDDEPIARTVRSGWHRLQLAWQRSNLSTTVKVIVLVLVGLALALNAEWLLPVCVSLAIIYGCYFGIRSFWLWRNQTKTSRQTGTSRATMRLLRLEKAERLELALRTHLKQRTASESLMEMSGGMLMSALVVAALALISLAIAGNPTLGTVDVVSFYSWLTISGVLASWVVMFFGRIWASHRGDSLQRRFILLAVGLGLGAFSFFVSEGLLVEMSLFDRSSGQIGLEGFQLLDARGVPSLSAYLLYFAGLFFMIRWWRQTDPLRRSRVSFFATGWALLWAFLLNQVCQFPLPWGVLLAGAISFAVQIATPTLTKSQRAEIEASCQ